jgi:hyperosmotically inducible periplasmic protein
MSRMYAPFTAAISSCALFLLCATPVAAKAQGSGPQSSSQTAPDNSAQNKDHSNTADQQPENKSDREITREIRSSIVADKSLSTYAHNVKIITQNGAVTLKGPVHSDDEKHNVESKAAQVVGSPDKVNDQLTVKQ